MEYFLNKRIRRKDYFQIFENQKSNKIQKPKDKDVSNSNILLRVTDEQKSNQFENIPKIQDDTLEKVDIKIKDLTENETHLKINHVDHEKSQIQTSTISNNGLKIDKNQIKIMKNVPFECNQMDGFHLDKVVQNTVNINNDPSTKNNKRVRKYQKSNLFKKFKIT